MDANNVFLCSDHKEEVYITMPLGFTYEQPHEVCQLQKSLYGLWQAPKQWFTALSSKLYEHGFVPPYAVHSLFTSRKHNVFMALGVYVDDDVLVGNDYEAYKIFKTDLNDVLVSKTLALQNALSALKLLVGRCFSVKRNVHQR